MRGVLLLLPALGNNFTSYLFSEDGDEGKSFAALFPQLGYEVGDTRRGRLGLRLEPAGRHSTAHPHSTGRYRRWSTTSGSFEAVLHR